MQYALAILAVVAGVKASPFPQAVTAAISPTGSPPPGCTPSLSGSFGIAIMNVSTSSSAMAKRMPQTVTAASQLADGQPQATPIMMAPISMIMDGQIQGGMHTMMMMPVSQIVDGQIQAPTGTPVSQIADGQIQAQTVAPVTAMVDGQPQAPTMRMTAAPVSQIGDAQPQAPTGTVSAVSQIGDAQPQAPTGTVSAVSQIGDAQPQAPTATTSAVSQIGDAQPQAPTATTSAVSQVGDAQPQAPTSSGVDAASGSSSSSAPAPVVVACATNSTLALTLADGVVKDAQGRTGYIASNYQFQFDAPPQAGALFTSGFSLCGNGSLALGGTNVFYQCLSGNFYNLYDRSWAAQCSPVTINMLMLKQCS
ncbi:hypothetical protein MMC16_007623 [Acarospora aff. strigata]|nr:hypothetical protein [Acarospora aff. strigata]